LQCACCEANEQAIKAFISKDISVAENVRNMQKKIENTYYKIEAVTKESSVDLCPRF